jgi:hypothetical protein
MKIIIINNTAFATHDNSYEISLDLYPDATDILISDSMNVLGDSGGIDPETGDVTDPTPPMTKDEIWETMSDAQKAASDLATAGVSNKKLTSANSKALFGSDSQLIEFKNMIECASTEYGVSTDDILEVLP